MKKHLFLSSLFLFFTGPSEEAWATREKEREETEQALGRIHANHEKWVSTSAQDQVVGEWGALAHVGAFLLANDKIFRDHQDSIPPHYQQDWICALWMLRGWFAANQRPQDKDKLPQYLTEMKRLITRAQDIGGKYDIPLRPLGKA